MSKTYEPTDQELTQVVGTWKTEAEVNEAGYRFNLRPDAARDKPRVGEVVVVSSHGKFRRGIVTSVGRLRAAVVLVTPTSIKNAREGYKIYDGTAWVTSHELARTQAGGPTRFDQIAVATNGPEMAEVAELAQRCEHGFTKWDCGICKEQPEQPAQEPASEPESAPATENTGSAVVTVLERVWEAVRANHADLPPVVIVTGSGFVGPARWGHFRANGWTDRQHEETRDGVTVNVRLGEMFVAGETLAKGATHTVETMLHEAAHVLAQVRGIKDTSRQGRWHNQKFRTLAEEVGLEYPKESAHPQAGFSECLLTPGTREEYAPVIEELDKAIRMHIELPGFVATAEDGEGSGGEFIHGAKKPRGESAGSTTNNLKATCGCPEPRIIRASKKVLDQGFIACGICHEGFEVRDQPAENDA